jgi:hypothetical protein
MEEINKEQNTQQKEKWYQSKFSLFGKAIPVMLVVGLVMVAGVSAGLAAYLSNTVTADVTVTSPVELKIGSAWNNLGTGNLPIGTIIGGETVQFYVSTNNKANSPITGTMWNVVSNTEGVTCADFASLSANVLDYDTGVEIYPTAPIVCVAMSPVDPNAVRMITTPSEPWTWAALHKDIAHVTMTFEEAAHGTYTLTTYVKP